MESMYSSAKREEQFPGIDPHPIHESICDSLEPFE
jgi:hypothetical protein